MSENKSESCANLSNTSSLILRSQNSASGQLIQQADSDEQLIDLWLHGRPKNTQDGYRREVNQVSRFHKRVA